MAKREYGFRCFFTYDDGRSVPWEDIGPEEKRQINRKWVERWERLAQIDLPKHPEAYRAVAEATTQEDIDRYYELFPERYEEDLKSGGLMTPFVAKESDVNGSRL